MKKALGIFITAAILTVAFPFDKVKADNPGTLMKDVNFDGTIDSRDASMVLAEYARISAGNEPTFTKTQVYVSDTDYDGQVTAVDASRILKTYSLESSGTPVPIKTVIFGITANGRPLNFQALNIEAAESYIETMTDGRSYTIIADTTIYQGENVIKKAYVLNKENLT